MSYHSIEAGGQVNKDAAWYYPEPQARSQPDRRPRRLLARSHDHQLSAIRGPERVSAS